jgi:metal-sulfur cluster biosynthetic enzyme
MSIITSDLVWERLKQVIDPELNIDVVSLGLIYDVQVKDIQDKAKGTRPFIHILMTLTTPGCPLAAVFDTMVKESLRDISEVDLKDIFVELTFDPPWVADMMSAEARAELGLY